MMTKMKRIRYCIQTIGQNEKYALTKQMQRKLLVTTDAYIEFVKENFEKKIMLLKN